MRIDVVTVFPEYLAPLRLSLIGKAIEAGTIELTLHDLRDYTHDRHRTVDDTPYGGGAGMLMKPEPWGEALDALLDDSVLAHSPAVGTDESEADASEVELIFPSPAGRLFTQAEAARLSTRPRLIVGCGRYEGIDARVAEYYRAQPGVRVSELSIGDYVLAGGEVAAMVMIEAIARLVPGVLGNSDSVVEESHSSGLLEYPSYTKPAVWRGLEVPEVLRSGDHAKVAAWRADQARDRTARVRPDLIGN